MDITQLTALRINVMTEAQYLEEKSNGDIKLNELYLIKEEETTS